MTSSPFPSLFLPKVGDLPYIWIITLQIAGGALLYMMECYSILLQTPYVQKGYLTLLLACSLSIQRADISYLAEYSVIGNPAGSLKWYIGLPKSLAICV